MDDVVVRLYLTLVTLHLDEDVVPTLSTLLLGLYDLFPGCLIPVELEEECIGE